MGATNIDRLPFRVFRRNAETIADMYANRWSVIARCDTCGLAIDVNLTLVARLKGPQTSLWNRRQPCKRIGCRGWMDFFGKHPERHSHEQLLAPDPDDKAAS